MAEIAYPSSLPGPMPGSFAPRPRRAASPLEGPLQQRGRQRDAAGLASQYTYVYTPEQMAAWLAWYRSTLIDGRRWFAHTLPGRGGMAARVVRYLDVSQQLLGAGIYRVTASFEQRGASLLPQESGDPYFANVLILLHGDGADGETNIVDHSVYQRDPVTEGDGALKLSTAQSKFGGSSLANTATDFLRYAAADFDWGDEDFTIEGWVYPTTIDATLRCWTGYGDDGGIGVGFAYEVSTGIGARFSFGTGADRYSAIGPALATNQWQFIALVRDGGVIRQYVNGVQVASAACAGSMYVATIYPHVYLHRRYTADEIWTGYTDDFRVTRGVCRYPGGTPFSPPAAAFPNN